MIKNPAFMFIVGWLSRGVGSDLFDQDYDSLLMHLVILAAVCAGFYIRGDSDD